MNIVQNDSHRVVAIKTDKALSVREGEIVEKTFRLRGKAILIGLGVLMTPDGPGRYGAVFPADAWAGLDFVHVGDNYGPGPDQLTRLFGINPILVPVEDIEMLPRDTLFIPESVERWCEENPLELPQ